MAWFDRLHFFGHRRRTLRPADDPGSIHSAGQWISRAFEFLSVARTGTVEGEHVARSAVRDTRPDDQGTR